MKQTWRSLVVTMLVVGSSLSFQTSAPADTFGPAWILPNHPNGHWYHADSSSHAWCYDNVTNPTEQVQFGLAMAYLDTRTNMTTPYIGVPGGIGGCTNNTDVVASKMNLSDGVFGNTYCHVEQSPNVCNRFVTQWDSGEILEDLVACNFQPSLTYYDREHEHTMRHEIGHSTGLNHNSGAPLCLINGSLNDAQASGFATLEAIYLTYNNHHKGTHVDPQYP